MNSRRANGSDHAHTALSQPLAQIGHTSQKLCSQSVSQSPVYLLLTTILMKS
ncbi:Uncharacterised protein [Vibrio cholerae]|nr:Uncharacterised protein [Vibrio cholerae]